jgi:hypothetical protein
VRKQLIDAAVQLHWQTRENVFEVRPRLMAVEFCRLHQAHDDRGTLARWPAGSLSANNQALRPIAHGLTRFSMLLLSMLTSPLSK